MPSLMPPSDAGSGKRGIGIRETSIDRGPLVLSHTMAQAQTVALGLFVNAGSRDEEAGQAGIAHALEHMLFKGTHRYDAEELGEALDRLGGNANAFTARERTCLHMHVLREDWPAALDLLLDMLLDSTIPEEEWQREREVIFSEMAMIEDVPEEWALEQHMQAYFPGQAIGRSTLGTPASLESIARADLAAYLQQYYRPPRLLIAAAGCIDHEALVERLTEISWGKGKAFQRCRPGHVGSGVHCLPRACEQAHMVLSYPGIEAAADARPLAWLANQILGGGMSSYLFREVREKRGLAYSVGSHLASLSDVGMWTITVSAEPKRLLPCVEVVQEILQHFSERLQADELALAARQLVVQLRMGMDNVETNMLRLGNRFDEPEMHMQDYWVERVLAVDLDELRQWTRARLAHAPLWTLCGPEQAITEAAQNCRFAS